MKSEVREVDSVMMIAIRCHVCFIGSAAGKNIGAVVAP